MSTSNGARKVSSVWNFFERCSDPTKAKCNVCGTVLARGGQVAATFGTSNMRRHLARKHVKENKLLTEQEKENNGKKMDEDYDEENQQSPSAKKQPTIESVFARAVPYQTSHPRHQQISRLVTRLFTHDLQPFSVVEDEAFRDLINFLDPRFTIPSRKHFTTVELPKLYAETKTKVSEFLRRNANTPQCMAFTCDIWTSRAVDGYQSLTGHVLDEHFQRQYVILATTVFNTKHTGPQILKIVQSALQEWDITDDKVSCFVRDNGTNITSALNIGHYRAIGCTDHTLQLAVNDGLCANENVSQCLKNCRSLVGHFKRSTSASQILHDCQVEYGVATHNLIQDVATRWQYTFKMLERILEQQQALLAALPNTTCKVELSDNDWITIKQLVAVLEPFDELSTHFEGSQASLGQVIPGINLLIKSLRKGCQEELAEVAEVRNEILASMKKRFREIESHPLYSMATVLDPRFKASGFETNYRASLAKNLVYEKLQQMRGVEPSTETKIQSVSAHKNKRKSIWDGLEEEFAEPSTTSPNELDIYFALPRCGIEENIFYWWRKHSVEFNKLSVLVRQVLCIPPTSADSERLFSCTGNIVSPTRCSLNPGNVKMVAFVKKNSFLF